MISIRAIVRLISSNVYGFIILLFSINWTTGYWFLLLFSFLFFFLHLWKNDTYLASCNSLKLWTILIFYSNRRKMYIQQLISLIFYAFLFFFYSTIFHFRIATSIIPYLYYISAIVRIFKREKFVTYSIDSSHSPPFPIRQCKIILHNSNYNYIVTIQLYIIIVIAIQKSVSNNYIKFEKFEI